jgi:Cohesin domain
MGTRLAFVTYGVVVGIGIALGCLGADRMSTTNASADGAPGVRVGSAAIAPGGNGTISVKALGIPSPGLGAFIIDVSYDPNVAQPASCQADPDGQFPSPLAGALCNVAYAPNVVRCVGYSAYGVTGDIALCDVTFAATGLGGETALALTVNVAEMANESADPIDASVENGVIAVGWRGDIDHDGDSTMLDAMLTAQYSLHLIGDDQVNVGAADVNCSGGASMLDAMLTAQKALHLISDFPGCEP